MRHHTRSVTAGLVLGLALTWGLGSVQPEPDAQPAPPPADPVQRELALIGGGLFREQSALPTDPEKSIEQMLDAQSAAIARLETRLAAMTPANLDALERRLASFEKSLRALDAPDLSALEREVGEIRRSIGDLDRRVADVPRSDLGELARTVQELERRFGLQTQRSFASMEMELRDARTSIRSLEDRVRTLERRIP